ncbi:hypothetical protein [Siphonobacter aquaeclarae]|uniref:Uncharacterized protein n=1 Tax=Siphonobacter aquaeclarae TaxID=563176 RepID=A0A1G9TAB3_9BACT|nr:hypothetical protein [Siphonobacter aquaeclarae]SDM44590.1 hypothetical protein SAMN04488090_3479 [Siphonobacter aquaeclarae]
MEEDNLVGSDAPKDGASEPKEKKQRKGRGQVWKFLGHLVDVFVEKVLPVIVARKK